MIRHGFVFALSLIVMGAGPILAADYLSDIKPLLREKCFSCHGVLKQEGGLRLDAASLIRKGGDSGPALVAGSAAKSLILQRITADDDNRMPPADSGARVTADQVAKLTAWIDAGAAAPDEAIPQHPSKHWAFLPPVQADVPAVPRDRSAGWIRSEIDRFLAAEHQRVGVEAVGETSRSMLLRRASLALTGLPPTPAERQAFLADTSEAAFENVVDQLLDSPRYGEHWARHFMDIWRYSDPSGYGKEIRDGREHIWRWRDWIIESLNADKGYDRMLIEMLAADELSPEDQASLRATGFLARNWYKFSRDMWLDNIVEHSSKAFLGLTMNCARCHDHKYDPFEHRDYYRLRAVFETHDVRDDALIPVSPQAGSAPAGQLVRVYDAHPDRPTFPFLQGNKDRPDKDHPVTPGIPKLLAELSGELSIEPISLPVAAWYPALRRENREAAMAALQADLDTANAAVEKARADLAQAKQRLAEFRTRPPAKPSQSKPSRTTTADAGTNADTNADADGLSVLADDFSKLASERWQIAGGTWSATDGRVVQSNGATALHQLVSTIDHPRDFRAKLRLRITGGERYQSAGLGFDVHGRAMNTVYVSVSGAKVQVAIRDSNGRFQYPPAGAAQHAIKAGHDYVLEIAVRDQVLNVRIDDEFKVAFHLPKRQAGRLSIWTFSATAEFDQLDVATLPPGTPLQPASGSSPPPRQQTLTEDRMQRAVQVAVAAERAAVARQLAARSALEDLQARTAAEMVKYGLAQGELRALEHAAALAARRHARNKLAQQVAQAEFRLAAARQKQLAEAKATRDKAAAELAAAEKELAGLRKKYDAAQTQRDGDATQYAALGPKYPRTSTGRRLAFARWIANRQNPLTARVLVNHVWLRHFGAPLVERTFDFGLRSPKPQHAELLDWLAVQFMEDGWSLKSLHKRLLTSGLYRLRSSPTAASEATRSADPDNHAFWRMNTRRMEAEVVRDSILFLGGSLDLTMGGEPIDHTRGQTVFRRSLYFRQDKERQMTFLSLFDGAKVNECYERKTTVAPQQALAMFNSRIAAEQSRKIAEMYKSKTGTELVQALFEHVLCRAPTPQERAECVQFLNDLQDSPAARQQLALVLLNHNDFVTIR